MHQWILVGTLIKENKELDSINSSNFFPSKVEGSAFRSPNMIHFVPDSCKGNNIVCNLYRNNLSKLELVLYRVHTK